MAGTVGRREPAPQGAQGAGRDLLDRAICLTLPEINDARRRDEKELWEEFGRVRASVLGALLDAVAMALRNLPITKLASKPRMADFALWVVAAEPALPWAAGAFLSAYVGNRGAANELALDSSIIVPPVFSLLGKVNPWTGTARELLDALEVGHAAEKVTKHKDWPAGSGAPRKLAGELRRLAPNLRRAGVQVTFGKHTRKGTPISIEQVRESPSPPSPDFQDKDLRRDGGDGRPEGPSQLPSHPNPLRDKGRDDGDDGDGDLRNCSDEPGTIFDGDPEDVGMPY